uniref:EF-hand domain-containing protein n=1 Tax=Globisporangium ultimum (strain ATCC 200006 / CBS 805.95 / DAOM BR144) TaxID=431595 RepID=K3WFF1_GLOUD
MGAAASTARDELVATAGAATGENAASAAPLACKLSDDQVHEYASMSHFSPDEVVALNVHYDLISSVKRDDGLIDRSEFQTALGFTVKESLYVDRIFQLFDANGDSFISFTEFLQSVSILSSKASTDEKLRFSFDILDFDRDGKLSKQELLSMLEACIHENSINIPKDYLETIVNKTMDDVDLDKDGFISFDEYEALGAANPHMLNHITFNISGIIAEYMPTLHAVLTSRIK